jgi:threonine aldolase
VSLDPGQIARLQRDWQFYVWDTAAQVVRWMTTYDTTEADVDAFVAEVWRTSGA